MKKAPSVAGPSYSKGSYAYGGYADIDDLFQQQARARDAARREALLHRILACRPHVAGAATARVEAAGYEHGR